MTPPRRAAEVIVITGGAGLLGSRVVPLVRRRAPGARVIAMYRRAPRRPVPGVESVVGDLRRATAWRNLPVTVTRVIHLAARIPWDPRQRDRASVVTDNLAPIARLVEASAGWPALDRIVYASSVSVYGPSAVALRESSPPEPASVYGAAKLAGEHLLGTLAARGVAVTSLRYSSIYGAGQFGGTVLPLFVERARQGQPLELFNAGRVQDFVYVDDAAAAAWLACRSRATSAINVGAGRSVSMRHLARSVVRVFDRAGASRVIERPTPAAAEDPGLRLHIGRARRLLGYRPVVDLEQGLRQLLREMA